MRNYLIILLLFSTPLFAQTTDVYSFVNADQKNRFANLTKEFRCLVCQNEALADSNAPLAQDLRADIANQILAGNSNKQIQSYLVQRYGDYVLFKPPVKNATYLLWFGPFVLLLVGVFILFGFVRRQKNAVQNEVLK